MELSIMNYFADYLKHYEKSWSTDDLTFVNFIINFIISTNVNYRVQKSPIY